MSMRARVAPQWRGAFGARCCGLRIGCLAVVDVSAWITLLTLLQVAKVTAVQHAKCVSGSPLKTAGLSCQNYDLLISS